MAKMKLRPQKGNSGHVTSYNVTIGSKEAREAGFLLEDGTPKPVRKTVCKEKHQIIIELDTVAEEEYVHSRNLDTGAEKRSNQLL